MNKTEAEQKKAINDYLKDKEREAIGEIYQENEPGVYLSEKTESEKISMIGENRGCLSS